MGNDIFAPYEIAKQLKELEFKEPCIAYYKPNITYTTMFNHYYGTNYDKNDIITAPTWEQVFKWFREKGYFSQQLYVEGTTDFFFRIFKNGKLIYESSCLFKKHHYYDYLNYLVLELIKLYKKQNNE